MPIQTFTIATPQVGSSKKVATRIKQANFGDGYSQRSGDGINVVKESWDLQWTLVNATIDAIEAFLVARAGYEAFLWTPPGGTVKKFICQSWSKQPLAGGRASISATFDQVFDP